MTTKAIGFPQQQLMKFVDCGTTTGTGFVYWDQLVIFVCFVFLIQTSL